MSASIKRLKVYYRTAHNVAASFDWKGVRHPRYMEALIVAAAIDRAAHVLADCIRSPGITPDDAAADED